MIVILLKSFQSQGTLLPLKFKGAVLPELGPALLGEVKVYAPDTERPFSEQTSIRGDKILKELIDELGNKILKLSFDMIIP
jgi:hypothetical protein